MWAKELFQQQAEILEKLKNIPQGRQGRNESVESGQGDLFYSWMSTSSPSRPGKREMGGAQPKVTPPENPKGAFLPCDVNGVKSHVLLDTGAEVTIISEDL